MAPWNYSVVGLCVLLLPLLLWKEIIRPNKSYLIARVIASIIAVITLGCLAFTFNTTIKLNNTFTTAILTTEGSDKDSIDLYKKENTAIYHLNGYPTIPNFDTLHIMGYGLTESEWETIKTPTVIFHPTNNISGICSADWQQHINAHQLFVVQGNYNNTFKTPIKLVLKAYNNVVDSVIINPNTKKDFNLKLMPQHICRALFYLMAIGKDTIEQEPIPTEVLPANKLNVLVLASSPDFENKFLGNWLAENGFSVALRTTISKGKYKQSFLDTTKFSLDHISTGLLNKFDVLVCDATELSTISPQEISAIKNQVSANGMGLIVRADSNITSGFYHSLFNIKIGTENKAILHLRIQDSLFSLFAERPVFIQPQAGTQPLVTDDQNRLLASSGLYGSGKIVLATANNTYSWLLANNAAAYQQYWSLLLQRAAHKTAQATGFFTGTSFPHTNQRVELFTAPQGPVSRINVNGAFISPQQNSLLPYLSGGWFWPTISGWQATVAADASIHWWYAFDSTAWKPIIYQQRLHDTYEFINNHKKSIQALNGTGEYTTAPFPKIYFFILFFLSCIFLWIEKKLL